MAEYDDKSEEGNDSDDYIELSVPTEEVAGNAFCQNQDAAKQYKKSLQYTTDKLTEHLKQCE
eukprot:2871861-Ditylum_brightwellii.AAC.1